MDKVDDNGPRLEEGASVDCDNWALEEGARLNGVRAKKSKRKKKLLKNVTMEK
ncbi:conserved hypothetical protein [Ricinus communis]|uniref:Uncharacterized protein n=1 Tax=Ricinus communis TaxID=3988 RepID=B9SBB3_RICCO|nr:conserved hypothetical protein [Ricinus communis]